MNQVLEKHYKHLEEQRSQIVELLKSLPHEALAKSPVPGKWSILEILTHLYSAEKVSMNYIKKKSLGIDTVGDTGIWNAFMLGLLRVSQRIPMRYKAPRVVVENTPPLVPMPELMAKWDLLRLELKSMLENVPEKYVHRLVYKHPVAGRLSFPQAVAFFSEHVRHHIPQINRLIKAHTNQ